MKFLILGFQDPATPIIEGIIDLHNYIFFYLVLVIVFVVWIIFNILYYFYFKANIVENNLSLNYRYTLLTANNVTHGTVLEIVWTLIPSVILILIAIPSFALLYSMDEVVLPSLVIKAIGHQWYWSYEYSAVPVLNLKHFVNLGNNNIGITNLEIKKIAFESYMLNDKELKNGDLRLLEVDRPIIFPTGIHIRILITALDVLHSWAVPSLGIKVDAVPGRLSQTTLFLKREGVFYGQCSELCGVNHGFMPIVVKGLSMENFINWINPVDKTDWINPVDKTDWINPVDKTEIKEIKKGSNWNRDTLAALSKHDKMRKEMEAMLKSRTESWPFKL